MSLVPLHKIPSRPEAQEIVRKLTELGMVSWTQHAKENMKRRNITIQQVLICLAKGSVVGEPIRANKSGNAAGYEIVIERSTAGDYLRIVICLQFSQKALVITAMKVK